MPSLHTPLKNWLVDLGDNQKSGGKKYYECYSGDNEPLDVRLRKRAVEYQPDVIWEHRGETCIFELAFQEDWRAIAGEITLAGLSGRVAKVFIITNYEDEKVAKTVSMLDEKYMENGWLKWGVSHVVVNNNLTAAKKKIGEKLRRQEWLW